MRTHTKFHKVPFFDIWQCCIIQCLWCSINAADWKTIYDNNQPVCKILFCNIKFAICLTKHHNIMDMQVEVWLHIISTFALDGGEWSSSSICCFASAERVHGMQWLHGWVSPRDIWMLWRRGKILAAVGIQPQYYGHLAHSLATNTAIHDFIFLCAVHLITFMTLGF